MSAAQPQPAEVIDYLREQFTRLNRRLDDLDLWRGEATRHFLTIERSIAAVRRDAVLDTEASLDREARQDALAARVARIERRLELEP